MSFEGPLKVAGEQVLAGVKPLTGDGTGPHRAEDGFVPGLESRSRKDLSRVSG